MGQQRRSCRPWRPATEFNIWKLWCSCASQQLSQQSDRRQVLMALNQDESDQLKMKLVDKAGLRQVHNWSILLWHVQPYKALSPCNMQADSRPHCWCLCPPEPPGPLCASQPIDRTFTSITALCLPPQPAQNSPSVSSQHALISSNSVTLPSEEAGYGFKQDKTRKTRCDREEGFTKDRKHRDMLKDQKRVMEGESDRAEVVGSSKEMWMRQREEEEERRDSKTNRIRASMEGWSRKKYR